MATSGRTEEVATLPAREFNRMIADPDVFCGGGSVAALACAGAAASALLVFRLSFRRKSNAGRRGEIGDAVAATEQLIEDFYRAADEDIASLQALLAAQRAVKDSEDRRPYYLALERAAEAPIVIAEHAVVLLDLVEPQLAVASRFTISDLGAAATIAEGAARAALLTAEVNIVLLQADPSSLASAIALRERWEAAHRRVVEKTAAIERATRAAVAGAGGSEKGSAA